MHLHPSCSETNLCPNSPYYKPLTSLTKSASSGGGTAAAPSPGATTSGSGIGSQQYKHSPLIGNTAGTGATAATIFNGLSAFAASAAGGGGGGGFGAANRTSAYLADEGAAIRRSALSTMSQQGDEYNSPNYLSWRKLQLSRAKLKASSKTSALLSGFAMVAMVEVQLDEKTAVPPAMLIAFAVCTTLLVAVHMLALMISTCILPNIETVCNLHSISLVNESPHERLHWYIETAWAFSTLLGLILFLLEIAILCWVKFYDLNTTAAWSACIVLIPVLVVFVAFAFHFYRSLMTHKYEVTVSGIQELEMLKDNLDHQHHHGQPYQSVQIV
uniref:Putative calcium release-activated calcium channel protein 1 n=2 Tax=Culex tarsalis TaxID=7177 RepID=A0A1Q3FJ92_CULTA